MQFENRGIQILKDGEFDLCPRRNLVQMGGSSASIWWSSTRSRAFSAAPEGTVIKINSHSAENPPRTLRAPKLDLQ